MEAFVPCGPHLASSRSSFAGATAVSCKPQKAISDRQHEAAPVRMLKLPSLPSLPSLPKFGKGEKKAPPPPPPAVKPRAAGTMSAVTISTDKKVRDAEAAKLRDQSKPVVSSVPKFYNPTTAREVFKKNAMGMGATAFDMRPGKSNNERKNENSTFRNMDPYTAPTVWARPGWSSAEAKVGVAAAFRQVFGTANLFESEMAEFAASISCVTETADMREFIRALGLSEAYRKRFFESCSNQRFVELNFKHFLGRAPRTQAEISEHIQIITTQGFNAEINSYIDSEEYAVSWGKSRVPSVNFRGGHPYNNDMNKLAVLNGSYVTSDRVVTKAAIVNGDVSGYTGFGVYKGLPEAWRGENQAREQAGPLIAFPDTIFWNAKLASIRSEELQWKLRFGSWFPYYYKNSLPYEQVIKPNLTNPPSEVDAAAAELKYGSLMGKFYVGTRKSFDMAPEIVLKAPTDGLGGMVSVAMKPIEVSSSDVDVFNTARKEQEIAMSSK